MTKTQPALIIAPNVPASRVKAAAEAAEAAGMPCYIHAEGRELDDYDPAPKYVFRLTGKTIPADLYALAKTLRKTSADTLPFSGGVLGRRRNSIITAATGSVATGTTSQIAVGISCHRPYLPHLEAAMDAVDAQTCLPEERFVILDGCSIPAKLAKRRGWTVIQGNWGSPNPGRNELFRGAKSEWVVPMDADNLMPPDYVSCYQARIQTAGHQVAAFAPTMQHYQGHPSKTRPDSHRMTPQAWRPDALLEGNWIDTASCWRRKAVISVGGFHPDIVDRDDWAVALGLAHNGWEIHPAPEAVLQYWRRGDGRAHAVLPDRITHSTWPVCTHAIVTLLRGDDELLRRWLKWLRTDELPPRARVYVVIDEGASAKFRQKVATALGRMVGGRLEAFTILTPKQLGFPCVPWKDAKAYTDERVHQHVASLYAAVLAMLREDIIITREDDIEGGRLRALLEHLPLWNGVAAVAAAYEAPDHPGMLCATNIDWQLRPIAEIEEKPREVTGFVPFGFTAYHGGRLRRALPAQCSSFGRNIIWGADVWVAQNLLNMGYRLLLHGGVRCTHHVHGKIREEAAVI